MKKIPSFTINPMGCCTGNYFIVKGELEPVDIAPAMLEMFEFIAGFDGDIPGATARDCGNYTFNDLEGARRAARRFADNTLRGIDRAHMVYPD